MTRCALTLLLLLGACSASDDSPGAPSAAEVAGADQAQVKEMSRDLVLELTAILRSVRDVPSAREARPRLAELAQRVPGLRKRRDELLATVDPHVIREDYRDIEPDIKAMTAEVGRLMKIPGMQAELQTSVDAVMAFFMPK